MEDGGYSYLQTDLSDDIRQAAAGVTAVDIAWQAGPWYQYWWQCLQSPNQTARDPPQCPSLPHFKPAPPRPAPAPPAAGRVAMARHNFQLTTFFKLSPSPHSNWEASKLEFSNFDSNVHWYSQYWKKVPCMPKCASLYSPYILLRLRAENMIV